ncbi:MAG: NADPH:quinone reductase [Thermoleophilaceae bacterium]|nr:NADPH:quinone reductase [Thermoleophilaceae bacterium]
MRAVQITEFGDLDVLNVADVETPEPGDGEVLIKVSHSGVNFADTHQRENSYLAKFELPLIPGGEVAGVVERGTDGLPEGTRVIAMIRTGGYAEYAVAPALTTFPIPDEVDDGTALALLIQGITAWHLYRTCAKIAEGESVVVISGAGGVGSLAVQLGKPMGAGRVIATASSEETRQLTRELGADAAVDPASEDLTAALIEANEGRQVDIVLEMAGGKIFDASLNALAPFGRLVTYGIASREPNEVQNGFLMRKSRAVVGFWLMHLLARPDLLRDSLADLLDRAARGDLRVVVGGTYPMSEVRRAHEDLQARRTTGKLLLDPAS